MNDQKPKAPRGRPPKAAKDRLGIVRSGRMLHLDPASLAAADRVALRHGLLWGNKPNRSEAVMFCVRHVDEAEGDDPAALVERHRKREAEQRGRIEQLEHELRTLRAAHERLLRGLSA